MNNFFAIGAAALLPEPPCSTIILNAYLGFIYGPYVNPRYALSIIVEHGGSGSKAAAPIAKKLFKFVIDRHELREKTKKKNLNNINI